jgi:outer membrane immunogenic protein
MRKAILILCVSLLSGSLMAQSPIGKGGKQINAGTGFSTWGIPLYAGMDFGVHPDITAGFNVSYRSYNTKWSSDDYRLSVLGVFANANYHFNTLLDIPQNWNFYAGLSLGFVSVGTPSGYDGGTVSGLGIDAQVGGRYFWNDRWGVNLEFGGGNAASGARIGVSYVL